MVGANKLQNQINVCDPKHKLGWIQLFDNPVNDRQLLMTILASSQNICPSDQNTNER